METMEEVGPQNMPVRRCVKQSRLSGNTSRKKDCPQRMNYDRGLLSGRDFHKAYRDGDSGSLLNWRRRLHWSVFGLKKGRFT